MNVKQLKARLNKTERTLSNHVHGGPYYHGINNARTQDLVDRFNELRDQAIEQGIWREWCAENGWAFESDAYDCLA